MSHLACYNFLHNCTYNAGESSLVAKTEADSDDITEHPHDDKPAVESRG